MICIIMFYVEGDSELISHDVRLHSNSGTSNIGPSEIGTQYYIQRTYIILFEISKITCPIVLVHLVPRTEDNLSIKDKTDEFILSPTCPIFRGSTVVHSVLTPNREILVQVAIIYNKRLFCGFMNTH